MKLDRSKKQRDQRADIGQAGAVTGAHGMVKSANKFVSRY